MNNTGNEHEFAAEHHLLVRQLDFYYFGDGDK